MQFIQKSGFGIKTDTATASVSCFCNDHKVCFNSRCQTSFQSFVRFHRIKFININQVTTDSQYISSTLEFHMQVLHFANEDINNISLCVAILVKTTAKQAAKQIHKLEECKLDQGGDRCTVWQVSHYHDSGPVYNQLFQYKPVCYLCIGPIHASTVA